MIFYSFYFLSVHMFLFLFLFFFSCFFSSTHVSPSPLTHSSQVSSWFYFSRLFLYCPQRLLCFIFLSSSLALSVSSSFSYTLTVSHTHYRGRTKPEFKAWFAQERSFWREGAAWCTLKREEKETWRHVVFFFWRWLWQCLWKHDVLPAVVFFFLLFFCVSVFFFKLQIQREAGTVRNGSTTVLRTVRFDRGSHGSLLLSSRTVLDAKRTAKLSGSRFFRSDRTVRSGFHNLDPDGSEQCFNF